MKIFKVLSPDYAICPPELENTSELEQNHLDSRKCLDEPSQETIAAIEEGERLIHEHDYGIIYDTVDDLFTDLGLA